MYVPAVTQGEGLHSLEIVLILQIFLDEEGVRSGSEQLLQRM